MEKELQGKLAEILTGIQESVVKAADFAWNQLTDIAQSYVVYGRAYATALVLTFIVILLTGLFVGLKKGVLNKTAIIDLPHSYSHGDWLPERVAAMIVGTGLTFLGFLGVMVNASNFLLVWFAPKVWLLKELAQLVK